MASPIQQYFKENELFDLKKLEDHCARHGVKMRVHPIFPDLWILNYTDAVQSRHIPWDNFNTRCRGLVVDLKYKLFFHPFDKFFNMEEESETKYDVLIKKQSAVTLEKLDGTMCTIFWHPEYKEWISSTRSEFVNQYSEWALSEFKKNDGDPKVAKQFTMVFEIISSQFRNVIDYRKKEYKEGIYILAIRNNTNDFLYPASMIPAVTYEDPFIYNFRTPQIYPFKNLDEVIAKNDTLSFDDEGFVLWFEDGTLVKIKSKEYLKAHRFLWNYSDDKVLEMLQNGDDTTLKEHLKQIPEEYEREVLDVLYQAKRTEVEVLRRVYELFSEAPKTSRKEFAQWVQTTVEKPYWGFLFSVMDNKPVPVNNIYRSFREGLIPWRKDAKVRSEVSDGEREITGVAVNAG